MNSGKNQMDLTRALVDLCHRPEPDRGPDSKYEYFEDADYRQAATRLLAGKPDGPLYIFGYGSLIWKPEFEVAGRKKGLAAGWHRSFCMEVRRWRGTFEQPGLMMCLDRGGSCEGVLLGIPDGQEAQSLELLLRREIGSHEELESVRWIDVQCGAEATTALAFYAHPGEIDQYAGDVPLEQAAGILARACGHWGSGAEYLYNTVLHLEELGIHDADLWTLQRLVAAEIAKLHLSAALPAK